jgi:hypothetical protein
MGTCKITAKIFLAGMILSFLFSSDIAAASVAGTYEATSSANLTVKGFFPDFTDVDTGKVTVKLMNNKKLRLIDEEGSIYSGNYKLLNKGTKIQFNFSKYGKNAFKKMLTLWIKDIAADKGFSLKQVKLTITGFKTTKAAVNKNGKPTHFTIKIHATVTGILKGKPMAGVLTYVTKVKFGKKL